MEGRTFVLCDIYRVRRLQLKRKRKGKVEQAAVVENMIGGNQRMQFKKTA